MAGVIGDVKHGSLGDPKNVDEGYRCASVAVMREPLLVIRGTRFRRE